MESASNSGYSPALHELNPQDPYLSVSSDPEELDFQASAIRLTPLGGSPSYHSSSPNGENETVDADPTIQTNLWAPQGNYSYQGPVSSPSSHAGGYLAPSDIDLRVSKWQDRTDSPNADIAVPTVQEQLWPESTTNSSSWLNQEQSIPSPSSMQGHPLIHNNLLNQSSAMNTAPGYGSAQLTVSTEHAIKNEPLSASTARGRSPLRSPIGITVSSVSRGDSPVVDYGHSRRPSRSSMHLSPGDASSDEDEGHVDDDHRSVSSISVARTNNGKWIRSSTTGHGGLEPSSRGNEYVPSPNELKSQRELDIKKQDITLWSVDVSAANSEAGDDEAPVPDRPNYHKKNNRLRARSTGDRPLERVDYFNLKSTAPGPGVLVHESEEEDEEDEEDEDDDDASVRSGATGSDSLPADANEPGRYDQSTPDVFPSLESAGSTEDFRLHPWQDPLRDPTPRMEAVQPGSSTAAMVAFEKRARDIETASLAATIDNNSIINVRSNFERMSLSGEPKTKEGRGSSLLKYPFFHTPSILKRQASNLSTSSVNASAQQAKPEPQPQRKESHSHRHRLSLSTKQHSRSPSLTSALMSMTGQMAAIGGNNAVHAVSPNTEVSPKGQPVKARGRSRSELPRPTTTTPGLMDLMTSHGGPPVANLLLSPRNSTDNDPLPANNGPYFDKIVAKDEEEDEDQLDAAEDKALVMEFPPVSSLPVPTFEGFRAQIMLLNPRLQPALIQRFANEQVRRYKKLVELQQKHAAAISNGKCKTGQFCFALGGEATLLEPRKTSASSETGQTQFRISNMGHDQSYPGVDGSFTPAQFPPGVPIPPVNRLPAQFECCICYDVKKFQKPSDWSKHVQEDVQPFTCSFPQCNEVRSFKRKADWVRHENELHRHLEWWTCSFHECNHTCYRKDNFVQHLVREHKMPDPKVKKGKGTAAEGHSGNRERDLAQLWKLLEDCRFETDKTAQSEPCRFCGNILGNWKKLTVHLGKHMEQLAMPVLELAKQHSTAPLPPSQVPLTGVSSGAAGTYPPLSAPFHGHLETTGAATMPPRTQYTASNSTTPVNPNMSYDMPLLGYPSISGSVLSTEPEPMAESFNGNGNGHEQYNPGYNNGMGQFDQATLHPPSVQTHLAHHQNSVTYPPPYNAVHRSRTPENNAPLMQSSYSQLQPQNSALYPAQASYPGYQNVASTSPYGSSPYTNDYSQM
ncbi:Zinc finger C2H2 [Penicillium angulare]|uniref:Zinc finger C2H2 n=1 Tax=Penicillium angulare TaxID=116970 RepID=UPI0025408DB7|nr:Zinc finger C2H2 [Penicillium angulare]KAJ5286855.1 Zinc finger C2H2 [Penicillium angulare]